MRVSVKETSMTLCNILKFRQIFLDIFSHLFYNPLMKRFSCILLLMFLCANCTFSAPLKKVEENKFVQSEQYVNTSNQANIFYAGNDIKSAFNTLLSIPEEERTAQNWLLLGNLLQDQGKLDEASFRYTRAIQVDDTYYKAYYNLGNIYLQDGRPNMAIEQYKKVIKLKPEYPYAHYNLGCAYIKLGKYSKAKWELLTAIDLKNTVADFHYNLAYVYKKLNKEKQAKTYIEYYNKIIDNQT